MQKILQFNIINQQFQNLVNSHLSTMSGLTEVIIVQVLRL